MPSWSALCCYHFFYKLATVANVIITMGPPARCGASRPYSPKKAANVTVSSPAPPDWLAASCLTMSAITVSGYGSLVFLERLLWGWLAASVDSHTFHNNAAMTSRPLPRTHTHGERELESCYFLNKKRSRKQAPETLQRNSLPPFLLLLLVVQRW